MNFLHYLESRRTEYFYNFLLFVGGVICLSQGVNEQTQILSYFSSFFFVLLIKRLHLWSSAVAGSAIGGVFGYVSFIWLSKFAEFTAFHLAIAFNSLLFGIIFSLAHYLFRRFPRSLFIHVFGLSVGIFFVRALFHYSPYLAYAKAFLTLVNTETVFDWLVPYFGSSITDILVLATGSLVAQLYLEVKKGKLSRSIYTYIIILFTLISIPFLMRLFSPNHHKNDTVKVALLQGNFNWSWEDRVELTDQIVDYYSKETAKAAGHGAKIVIWPEYAVAKDILHSNQQLSEKLVYLSHMHKVVIVTGSLELITDQPNPNNKWTGYDVSLVFDPEKVLLEPYRAIHPISSNVLVGNRRVVFDTKYGSFPVISCFEVAYHKFVADYSTPTKSESSLGEDIDFLVGIANIQLFLSTDGTRRIQNHIRRIAMENGKYFIYVSNTGPSFVINPQGEFEHIIPIEKRDTLIAEVQKIKRRSFYSIFQEIPLITVFVLIFIMLFRAKGQRK